LAASNCAINASTSGRLEFRHRHIAAPGLDARGMECLVADQHRNAMPRDRGDRLQRRDLRARRFGLGVRALHVERSRQARAVARLHQAQRLVVGGGDLAQRIELAQRPDQGEVVVGHVGHHHQSHAAHAVFGGQRVGRGGGRAGAQATAQVELPGDVESCAGALGVRQQLLDRIAVAAAAIAGRADGVHAGHQEGAADRDAGARSPQALGSDLDVAILVCGAAHQVGQDRVAEAFPPGGLGFHFRGRTRGESLRHLHRGLEHRR
jgi:hypothetical protein